MNKGYSALFTWCLYGRSVRRADGPLKLRKNFQHIRSASLNRECLLSGTTCKIRPTKILPFLALYTYRFRIGITCTCSFVCDFKAFIIVNWNGFYTATAHSIGCILYIIRVTAIFLENKPILFGDL